MLQPKDTDWLNGYKNKIHIYAGYTSDLKTFRLKVRGWKYMLHANGIQKKATVAVLISDKIDLKIKKIIRDKEGHYIMIKRSIQEEHITIINIYAANIGAPQYIRQTLTYIIKVHLVKSMFFPVVMYGCESGTIKKAEC